MRLRSLLIVLLLVLCPLPLAIAQNHATSGSNEDRRPNFDLMHLWLTDIEAPALDYLKESVTAAGANWSEHHIEGNFYGIRSAFAQRLSIDAPPDGVFWIGGEELTSMVETKIIRTITPDATTDNLSDILKPEIIRIISDGESYTSLPLVIHTQNIAIINQHIFNTLGIEPPKSWSDFIRKSEQIKSAGYIPLAMSEQRWQLRFLFVSIMSDGLDKQEFLELLLGARGDAWTKAKYVQAFQTLLALKQYTNGDYENLSWNNVLSHVREGNAAMTITGDFAAPALTNDPDIVCTMAPGSNFVSWSFDVLAFTYFAQPSMRAGQDIAIRALSTNNALRNFGLRKGGVPVVKDIKFDEVDRCSANSMKSWNEMEKVHLNSERWRLQLNSISSIAQAFWRADDPNPEEYASLLVTELQSIFSD